MKALHGAGLGAAASHHAGQGTGYERLASRAAARLQVLRQDIPPRLLQAGARAELRRVWNLFRKNRLTVTRQVPCHPGDNRTVDMVFAVNGLPVATSELKNPGTGQNWRNAVRQYKEDRDPRAPLFEFKKRALGAFRR